MKQFWTGACALALLSACGDGNPFTTPGSGGVVTPPSDIPASIRGDVASVTFDAGAGVLAVTGLTADADALNGVYTRNAALDQPGYQAFTIQESPTERHVTAFVQEIDGTRGAIAVSGGQFGTFFGGGLYSRDGAYDPASGVVQYGGDYVGITNVPGAGTDLLPPPGGTPVGLLPSQAGVVTGTILITADFTDNGVDGRVTDRVFVSTAAALEDLDLFAAEIEPGGSFVGTVRQDNISKGRYAGVFGGTDARVVAGSLYVEGHVASFDNEEEHGLFVLVQCGTAGASPICP